MLRVLLVGRKLSIVEDTRAKAKERGATIFAATSSDEVEKILAEHDPHAIIMGAGLDLDQRLAIVRAAFERSNKVEVHLKNAASGPDGFIPFVEELLGMLVRQRGNEA